MEKTLYRSAGRGYGGGGRICPRRKRDWTIKKLRKDGEFQI